MPANSFLNGLQAGSSLAATQQRMEEQKLRQQMLMEQFEHQKLSQGFQAQQFALEQQKATSAVTRDQTLASLNQAKERGELSKQDSEYLSKNADALASALAGNQEFADLPPDAQHAFARQQGKLIAANPQLGVDEKVRDQTSELFANMMMGQFQQASLQLNQMRIQNQTLEAQLFGVQGSAAQTGVDAMSRLGALGQRLGGAVAQGVAEGAGLNPNLAKLAIAGAKGQPEVVGTPAEEFGVQGKLKEIETRLMLDEESSQSDPTFRRQAEALRARLSSLRTREDALKEQLFKAQNEAMAFSKSDRGKRAETLIDKLTKQLEVLADRADKLATDFENKSGVSLKDEAEVLPVVGKKVQVQDLKKDKVYQHNGRFFRYLGNSEFEEVND